jgi:hypothetical protein
MTGVCHELLKKREDGVKEKSEIIVFERIERCIYLIRGQKVMLSTGLARLYGVEPRILVQAVKRNAERFPSDFMFQLAPQEVTNLKSQIVISSWGGPRATPYAFTEQGVAMLASVLNSKQAIEVNIAIMRAFVRLRHFLASQSKLARRLRSLEQQVGSHHKAIGTLFDAMQQLTTELPPAIGFQYPYGEESASGDGKVVRERGVRYRVGSKAKRSVNT